LAAPASFALKNDRIEIAVPLPESVTIGEPYFFPAEDGPVDYAAPQSYRRNGDLLIVRAESTPRRTGKPFRRSCTGRWARAGDPGNSRKCAGGRQPDRRSRH
jgi:hypothetical protein